MTNKRKSKPLHKSDMRRWHSLAGLFSAIFLVLLSVTGIYLNHQYDWFQDTTLEVEKQGFRSAIMLNDTLILATADGIYQDKNGIFTPFPLPYPIRDVTVLEQESDTLWVGSRHGVLFRTLIAFPYEWERVVLPEGIGELRAIDVSGAVLLSVVGSDAVFVKDGEQWQHRVQAKSSLRDWILRLHRGEFWDGFLKILNDLSALILLGLVGSGCIIYWRLWRSKGTRKG